MTNQALFRIGRKAPTNFSDMLGRMQLGFLEPAEFVAPNARRDGIKAGMHHKDIHALARNRVTAFALTVEQTAVMGVLKINSRLAPDRLISWIHTPVASLRDRNGKTIRYGLSDG